MRDILLLILMSLPVAICATAHHFYKRNCPRMTRFCLQMLTSCAARKGWTLGTLLVLLVTNLLYLNVFGANAQVVVATILCLCLFTHKKMELAFNFLQNPVAFWSLFGLQLASFIFPSWWPLTLDTFIVMVASMFYPALKLRQKLQDPKVFSKLAAQKHAVIGTYYA